MANICIVTTGHLSSNPRTVKEASALVGAGHDVHVIHGHYAPFFAGLDADVPRAFTAEPVPFGPHLTPRRRYWRQTLSNKAARKAAAIAPLRQSAALLASGPVAWDLARQAAKMRADLYIAHYVAALPAAAKAAARHGARYAFDAEDFHLGDLPDTPRHATDNAIIKAIEGRYLPGAAFVTAASPGIADAYVEAYGIARPTVVLNVFPRAQAPAAPTPAGTVDGPSLYWFSQTIGRDRGLECAVEAIAMATTRPHLYLRGTPSPGYERKLMSFGADMGVSERIHILPPAPPDQMEALATIYDAGFVGETGRTRNHQIMLSNKQFSFILAGIPTLLSDIPSHRAFAQEADGAVFLYRTEDPLSLADALDRLFGDPDGVAASARAHAHHLGQSRYNWDVEQEKLLREVDRALSQPRKRMADRR